MFLPSYGLAPFVVLGQYSGSKWAWAKPKPYVSELTLEASLQFSKFGVSGSFLCAILWSRWPDLPCVLSC